MAEASFNQKAANLWTSRIIPLILVGIVGYVTWVIIVLLCGKLVLIANLCFIILMKSVNYLLQPTAKLHDPRHGAAIAILVLYAILLLFMAFTYFRLIYTVTANPGYVAQGPQWHLKQQKETRTKRQHRKGRKSIDNSDPLKTKGKNEGLETRAERRFGGGAYTEEAFDAPTTTEPAPGLRDFYDKDVFVCQGDGRPIWCSTCENWKPDRAHHCREIERCVRKMDHFCPW